jgi:predicted transcriptional regulator
MTREEVHHLIDELPDEQLESVAALIVEVISGDDEPLSETDVAELDQGLEEARAGRGEPAEQVLGELGL